MGDGTALRRWMAISVAATVAVTCWIFTHSTAIISAPNKPPLSTTRLSPIASIVELFKHPHVLLLQIHNCVFKLPGGRLRPGESDIDGLKRKLVRKLSVNEEGSGLDWEVRESLGMWWRSDFENLLYPYLAPNVKKPKECIKLFLVKLPASQSFIVPRNLKLLAVLLCQIHEDHKTYGPIISGVPQLLSKFSFNVIEP
ncbi:Cleavage/polyadenylation specificity factor subunit 5 protein [Actinidia chinensis var. chinensis]|uniref:Cleavage/polyadenylation specificity factor subunit 5 protein n=1 Tax=Actinidia chinensis var. chinensis TaxID=1590841 RepID=A0A2R6R463_ACTCC|nr:Cleavage/polyadenylation specificity factor subunit 5 protein [Actinidia chinensis var. chinensis]